MDAEQTTPHTTVEITSLGENSPTPTIFDVTSLDGEIGWTFRFQDGPIGEHGVNGVMNEDLLWMIKVRLEAFQDSKFACQSNAVALDHITGAINALAMRTAERQTRGVEGTHEV